MILTYMISALAKPELASGSVELLLRLILSPEIRRHCKTCFVLGKNQAGRLTKLASIFVIAGLAALATERRRKRRSIELRIGVRLPNRSRKRRLHISRR